MKQCRKTTNSHATADECAAMLLEVIPAVMRSIRTQMRLRTAPELSVVQFRSLALAHRSGGATISDIAEHIGVTLPSASKLVDTLVRLRYLRRIPHPTDRRVSLVIAPAQRARILTIGRHLHQNHLSNML